MYSAKDTVSFQGRLYECKQHTYESPFENPSVWNFIGSSNPYKSSNPPLNPVENQSWINDNGIQYFWLKDDNGFQWVQIWQTIFWGYDNSMNEESFEKFKNRRKNKPSGFSKKQQTRNKRGNRHEQKQQLNDQIYRKDFE